MRLTIPVLGLEPIYLDQSIIAHESGKFDAATSYASKLVSRLSQKAYLTKKLPLKLGALNRLMGLMKETPKSYFEPMAGVGLSARLFDCTGDVILNDLDKGCQSVLKANFPKARVYGKDARKGHFPVVDLIFLDFNNFTMKRFLAGEELYVSMMDRAFASARMYVIVNDCTPFYFRYGKSSFETYSKLLSAELREINDYFFCARDLYRKRYNRDMMAVSYFDDSSFQLFGPKGKRGALRIEKAEPLRVVVSEGLLT